MTDGQAKAERLQLIIRQSSPWPYLLLGGLVGAAFEMLINAPLDALFRNLFEYLFAQNPIRLTQALAHLAQPGEFPAVSLTGFILGATLGFVYYRLKVNRQRLLSLRQEFEIQVAALRHHYKNLALGIGGFSGRARRKLENLQQQIHQSSRIDANIQAEMAALEKSITILEDASNRLTSTLVEELGFLKALQTAELDLEQRDIFPVLRHSIQELLELRFRDKTIGVEINGQPLEWSCDPLVFSFAPYVMEIILQNILSNAMRHANFIQVKVGERNSLVTIEIQDNGPGINLQEIKRSLISAGGRREAESTQLGLKVVLHLMEKCGGRLYAAKKPDGGATFILEFPSDPLKHLS